MTDFDLFIGLN